MKNGSLVEYYKDNFSLHKYHNYSLTELDNMLPWERLILIDQIKANIQAETERAKIQALERAAAQ